MCNVLESIGSEPAVHLQMALLLQHHCHMEAILLNNKLKALRQRAGSQKAKVASSIVDGLSSLLPPVLQELCSEELVQRIDEVMWQTGECEEHLLVMGDNCC